MASTNHGCKAIHLSGGATSVLLKDGMTRAFVVRFATSKKDPQLKFFLEDPINFKTLSWFSIVLNGGALDSQFCFFNIGIKLIKSNFEHPQHFSCTL